MFCVTKRELMLLAVSHVQMHCGCFGDCCVRGAETYQRAPLFLQIQHLIITHKMDPARSETDALPGLWKTLFCVQLSPRQPCRVW